MSGVRCAALNERLSCSRATRQRCAASLRAALRQLAELKANGAPLDWQQALEIETRAAQAAIDVLLTPAVVPQPVMSKVDREIEYAVALSMRPEDERVAPMRERNRSILPRKQVVVEEVPPAPQAPLEPEPAAPVLSGWRLNRARRQGLVTA